MTARPVSALARRARVGLGALISCAVTFSTAGNQIGPISATMGDWCFLPVLADSGEPEQILAVRTTSGVESVTAMRLFPVPDGSWAASAWSGVPIEAAIAWTLSAETGMSAATFEPEALDSWPVDTDPALVLHHLDFPVAPVEFADGVEATDPLAPIVQAVPGLLGALEATGYPAVARVGGATVTSGSFTAPSVGDPAQLDCLAVVALLDSLRAAFDSQDDDVELFRAELLAGINSSAPANCGCIPTTIVRTGPWTWTCGPWNQTGGPYNVQDSDFVLIGCEYEWERAANGTQRRLTLRILADCSYSTCLQTRFNTCSQQVKRVLPPVDGYCPQPPSTTPSGVKCGPGFGDECSGPGSWIPATCP